MDKNRILHIVPNMQSGGLETFIMNIYRKIDKSTFQFDFLVHYKEPKFYDEEIERLGGKIFRFSLRDDNNIFKYIIGLDNFFKEHNEYKIVHCHMASIGFLVFLIAKKNGIKIRIAHSHNSDTEKTLKGFIKSIMIKPYKYLSTHRFACSEDAGKFLFGKKNFEIIENAIDIDKFKFDEETRIKVRKELNVQNKFVLGHIGRFCDQKNHDFLIDVFYELYQLDKNLELLLIGDGELKEKIKEKIKKLELEKSVILLENRKDVNELYQVMDYFLFPSKFEGLGIVLIEAQAAGLNVIASDAVPNEVIVTNKIKLLKLCKDEWIKEFQKEQNINNREIIDDRLKRYDINNLIRKIESKYCELLEENQ